MRREIRERPDHSLVARGNIVAAGGSNRATLHRAAVFLGCDAAPDRAARNARRKGCAELGCREERTKSASTICPPNVEQHDIDLSNTAQPEPRVGPDLVASRNGPSCLESWSCAG